MKLLTAEKLAKDLMREHGVGHIPFKFTNSKASLGICVPAFYEDKDFVAYIGLSRFFVHVNFKKIIRFVIMHEIVHALTPGHWHDKLWKRKAIELGIEPGTNISSYDGICNRIKQKYEGICPVCGEIHYVYRLSIEKKRFACRKCGRKDKYIDIGKNLEFEEEWKNYCKIKDSKKDYAQKLLEDEVFSVVKYRRFSTKRLYLESIFEQLLQDNDISGIQLKYFELISDSIYRKIVRNLISKAKNLRDATNEYEKSRNLVNEVDSLPHIFSQ